MFKRSKSVVCGHRDAQRIKEEHEEVDEMIREATEEAKQAILEKARENFMKAKIMENPQVIFMATELVKT